ncbi:hypothetical protein CEXT_768191 [Caerostris extrusa]|uniref:Uncharacterized protein n=1 Tax=Caerostris extrusa TaxID=172846 RepID=A0AAV4QQU4_CAEEX|nr:hypothetical protein CEXT_768191 [Caerostris extrusa]
MTDLSNLMKFISLFPSEAKYFSADRIAINVPRQRQPILLTTPIWLVCFLSPFAVYREMSWRSRDRGTAAVHESPSAEVFGGSFYFMASKVFGTGRKNEECLGCRW